MSLLETFISFANSCLALLVLLVLLIVFIIDRTMHRDDFWYDSVLGLGIAYVSKPLIDIQTILLNFIEVHYNLPKTETSLSDSTCLFIGILLLLLGGCLKWGKSRKKEKIPILNMLGMHYQVHVKQSNCDSSLSKLIFEEEKIDFIEFFDKTGKVKESDNSKICEMIQRKCASFVNHASNSSNAFFTGMSPIPYEVYAGTFLNGSNVNDYLEFDSKNSKKFYKLERISATQKELISPNPFLINETENMIESTEVNLSIEVTSKISVEDLCQFQSFSALKIGLQENKDNLIREIAQLISLKNEISSLMEKCGKKGINRIHITAAIPSCLAVEIGKEIVQLGNRLPEVVIYHYVRTSKKKYPFGLIVNGSRKGELYHV